MSIYKIGDKVIAKVSIWDDGEDHHPPGYLCVKGETLVVRRVTDLKLDVSHEEITDSSFMVTFDEVEKLANATQVS